MGKISTINRKEAIETGKIYLKPSFNSNIEALKEIKIERCNYCMAILTKTLKRSNLKNNVCSDWCNDMINPPEIKHTCKICGKAVKAFRRHQGKYYISSGIYPKYCKKCSPYNKNKNEKKTQNKSNKT